MPHIARSVRAGIGLIAASVVIGLGVTVLGAPGVDQQLIDVAGRHDHGWFADAMRMLSDVGYLRVLAPTSVLLALILGVLMRQPHRALAVAVSVTVAATVSALLKRGFERARPDGFDELLAAGFSMPSGHAAASSAFAASIVLAASPGRWRWIVAPACIAFAAGVGVSRVVIGVHFPTDVLAGWCLGAGVAMLVASLVGAREPAPRD